MIKNDVQGFDISSCSVLVIGCGGLGCNIAVHLAGSGIGRMFIADFDTVSETNLNRQFLYSHQDIGKFKTDAAKKRLSDYAPDCEIITVNKKITQTADLDFAKKCDIILLGADNNDVRKITQQFCAENTIPLINGGINGFYGSAYMYIPEKTPCLDCAGLCDRETASVKSVSSAAGIIGALEAELCIKYLIDSNTCESGILHIYDNGEITKLKINPQKNCGICGRN